MSSPSDGATWSCMGGCNSWSTSGGTCPLCHGPMMRAVVDGRDRLPVRGGLRVRVYDVLDQAVEEGVSYGWHRAHKHTETPTPEQIREAVRSAVMSELFEWFDVDDKESP